MSGRKSFDGAPSKPSAYPWIVASLALLGLAIAVVVGSLETPRYESTALVTVVNPVGTMEDEALFMTSPQVLAPVEAALGFAPDLKVTANEAASLLTITSEADDPNDAAEAATIAATTYSQAQTASASRVVQTGEANDDPVSPNRLLYLVIGTALGAIVGIAISSLMALFGRTTSRQRREPLAGRSQLREPAQPVIAMPNFAQPDAPVGDPADAPTSDDTDASTFASASARAMSESTDSDNAQDAQGVETVNPPPPALLTFQPDNDSGHEQEQQYEADRSEAEAQRPDQVALPDRLDSGLEDSELAHAEQIEQVEQAGAADELEISELTAQLAEAKLQVRRLTASMRRQGGSDQHRIGDLEAQIEALETELATLREQLELDRIVHSRRLTEQMSTSDRALDNARLEYRGELEKHDHNYRSSLADHRRDLDEALDAFRTKQAEALEAQHREYEHAIEHERQRRDEEIAAATERHQREVTELVADKTTSLQKQAAQTKETIVELRAAQAQSAVELRDLGQAVPRLRTEVRTARRQAREHAAKHNAQQQELRDELALTRKALTAEKERNSALRGDVLRRTAEANQRVDETLADRAAQLVELEASMARLRDYADQRVSDTAASAEERARAAATREAELARTISRLERELNEARGQAE